MTKTHLAGAALAALLAAYPLLVYLGLQYWSVTHLAWLVLAAGLARLGLTLFKLKTKNAPIKPGEFWLAAITLIAAAITLVWQSPLGVKFYPVLVNALMLTLFAATLLHPPSMIERLARLHEPDLPPEGVRYTRKVTVIWCVFFVANGTIAAITVFLNDEIWALYNGLIAYGLIGALLAGEWLVRRRIKSTDARSGSNAGNP